MAAQLHTAADDLRLTLAAAITSGDTSLAVATGQGATCPATPFWLVIDSEQVEVTTVATDTLTIARAQNDTTATAHASGSTAYLRHVAARETEVNTALVGIYAILFFMAGGGNGVIRNAQSATFLKVVAQDTPDLTVLVGPGAGFVSYRPVGIMAPYTSAVIVPPTGNPRIDLVQISSYDVISIKAGTPAGSPSAPTVDTDNLALATIAVAVGATEIENADITDARVYV